MCAVVSAAPAGNPSLMSRNHRRTHSHSAKSHSYTQASGGLPEEGAGHRQARLEHIILDELQCLISDDATDPAVEGIRILAVHLSPDGGHARVAYAVVAPLNREPEVRKTSKEGLGRAAGFLRARLAETLDLKKTPRLTFAFVGVTQTGGAS
jgi:ribosome-binding factor A